MTALPLALLVFGADGTILHANERVHDLLVGRIDHFRPAPMLGVEPDDLIGSNVLELVHPDDRAFAHELFEFSAGLPLRVMGPVRLRYLTVLGEERYTDFWVENRTSDPAVGGYVALFTEEATQHRLADAVTLIAADEPLPAVLRTVAESMAGHPMQSLAVVVGRRPDGTLGPLHDTSVPIELAGGLPGGPWEAASALAAAVDLDDLTRLPTHMGVIALACGLEAVWTHPIVGQGVPAGAALVCWRREEGPASPNQRIHVKQAVDVCALAFGRAAHRRQLEHLAYTDPLTGLSNRAQLGELGFDLSGSAVLYVDLDDFKDVNDRLGHEIGDLALQHVAECLRSVVRHDDHVVRLGGDEFVVICRPPCPPEVLQKIAQRLIDAVSRPVELAGHPLSLGACVGIVHHRDHPDLDNLIQEADAALYLAKAKGRGKWWMAPIA